ncbi:hypothetical protein, partial [Mucilaginibacter lappiensis]
CVVTQISTQRGEPKATPLSFIKKFVYRTTVNGVKHLLCDILAEEDPSFLRMTKFASFFGLDGGVRVSHAKKA